MSQTNGNPDRSECIFIPTQANATATGSGIPLGDWRLSLGCKKGDWNVSVSIRKGYSAIILIAVSTLIIPGGNDFCDVQIFLATSKRLSESSDIDLERNIGGEASIRLLERGGAMAGADL
jgi:hypothetical protein